MSKGSGLWKFIAGVAILGWAFGGDDKSTPDQTSVSISQPTIQTTAPIPQPVTKPVQPQVRTSKLRQQLETTVKKAKPQPIFSQKNMYVDASRLNVRNGPAKTDKVIWTLKRDQKVLVVNKSGDWLQVKGQRFTGWVFGTYLTNNPAPKPAIVKKQKPKNNLSTAEIKNILIKRSHAYYSGNCPCPYNTTRANRRCGKRSAYSRPGGASPLCYPSDVSAAMVAEYKARQ